MKHTPNPDTHCLDCGEVLSEFHHCWQCQYPPMDPKQDNYTTQTATATRSK